MLAVYAISASMRPGNDKFTYGLVRAEVVAGLVNGVFLLRCT